MAVIELCMSPRDLCLCSVTAFFAFYDPWNGACVMTDTTHRIKVAAKTPTASLTQHMAASLREHGRFIATASRGQAADNMQWAIAALDGFIEGYAVSHSSIQQVPGRDGDQISVLACEVWLEPNP